MSTGNKRNEIFCCIFNHNKNKNSKLWLDRLVKNGFDAYIFDSGSDKPLQNKRVFKFDNIYWGGMYDELLKYIRGKDYKYVLHVDDDILIDESNFEKLVGQIDTVVNDKRIGIYQPSTTLDSHNVWETNKNKNTHSIRLTSNIEEWMWLIKVDVLLDTLKYNINYSNDMKYGWGVGLLFAKSSLDLGYMNVVDDNVIVVHPNIPGSYDTNAANVLMNNGFEKIKLSYTELVEYNVNKSDAIAKKLLGYKVVCCLLNYKNDENCEKLYNLFSKEFLTYVIDTFHREDNSNFNGNVPSDHVLLMNNIYFGGSVLASYEVLKKVKADFLITVTTDILIDDENADKMLKSLKYLTINNDVGAYTATLKFGSKALGSTNITVDNCHLFNHKTGMLRDINRTEGWFSGYKKEVLDDIIPYLKLPDNKHGWGIDDALCRRAIKRKLRVVADDRYEVFHPAGLSYNNTEAQEEYDNFKKRYIELGCLLPEEEQEIINKMKI